MALASESEWESDPELKAMRKDFVASFEGRWKALEAALPAIRAGGEGLPAALKSAAAIAHKLAGAAETYGFATLTRASAAYEDWYDSRESGHDPGVAAGGAELLMAVLKRCVELGKDAPEFAADTRLAALERALKA